MIFNAKLLRVDQPAAGLPSGKERWTEGASIDVQCTFDQPNHNQRWAINQLESDATAVLYVLMSSGVVMAKGQRVVVQPTDGNGQAVGSAETLVVRNAKPLTHAAQSHYECFVRTAP